MNGLLIASPKSGVDVACAGKARRGFQFLAILAGCMTLPFGARALDARKSLYQYNVHSWTRQSGLPSDVINAVVQGNDGFIWIATDGGLARFDGQEFTRVANNLIPASAQKLGSLSPAMSEGVWFTSADGTFGRISGDPKQSSASFGTEIKSRNRPVVLRAADGEIWIGSETGIAWYRADDLKQAVGRDPEPGTVLSLCEDHAHRIWIGTSDRGLFVREGDKLTKFAVPALAQHRLTAVAVADDGRVWVGTEAGLKCYDAQGNAVAVAALDVAITALHIDLSGDLWVGTAGSGMARFQHGQFTSIRKSDGIAGDDVTAIWEDREGSIWIGAREGLAELSDVRFPIVSSKEGIIDGSVHSVAPAVRGGLWISTVVGFSYYGDNQIENFGREVLPTNMYVKLAFQAKNGEVYVVDGDKAITVFANHQVVARIQAPEWPEAFTEDGESVLVNAGSELYRIVDHKLVPYQYRTPEPPRFDWIQNLAVAHDGAILVASAQGVFRLKDGNVEQWSTPQGLASDRAQFVMEDVDGSIWCALPNGMARIRKREVRNITEENGLPDPKVFAFVPDDRGYFWLQTSRGIVRISRYSLNVCADGKSPRVSAELFDDPDSVKTIDRTDQVACGCKTRDGRIWFPSPRGVIMIDPAGYFTNKVPPIVHIREVKRQHDDQTDELGNNAQTEFSFAALSYLSPNKVQVEYRLIGLDSTWVDAGFRRSVRYARLQPGNYRFEVRARNGDGVWNSDSLEFELLPPFYRRTWFYLLCATTILGLAAATYSLNVRRMQRAQRRLQQENELLESKVAERTKELGQAHRQLLEASRKAGMAEVATSVLHNVGNVLNSANVSAGLLLNELKKSRLAQVAKLSELLAANSTDLPRYLTEDAKGRKIVPYLGALGADLTATQTKLAGEIEHLMQNLDHIKAVVAMQQSLAKVGGVRERFNVCEVMDDALRLRATEFAGYQVRVTRDYRDRPVVNLERHKVMQIVVNLVQNAAQACRDSDRKEKSVIVAVEQNGAAIITVTDNGVGIEPGNLTRIFSHGFTTKKDGHGFGLHSSALAAKELGGALHASSAGPGHGATFVLELPLENSAGAKL